MLFEQSDAVGSRYKSFSTVPDVNSWSLRNRLRPLEISYKYDTNFENCGIALILNHYKIKNKDKRKGTAVDCKKLCKTLESFSFQVMIENDLTSEEIQNKLCAVANMDHSNSACLMVIVMTHGKDQDDLFASDGETYPVDTLWEPFLGNKCPSLVGKPKLFFIQACRGKQVDEGVIQDCIDAGMENSPLTVIPTMADLLVMYSTCDKHISWRNVKKGSWFIQALCTELNENGRKLHLLEILVRVTRRVAYLYESKRPKNKDLDKKKQCPVIVSMLTKILYLN